MPHYSSFGITVRSKKLETIMGSLSFFFSGFTWNHPFVRKQVKMRKTWKVFVLLGRVWSAGKGMLSKN